jgi:fatty acid desaturase
MAQPAIGATIALSGFATSEAVGDDGRRDPRAVMAARLPAVVQPFLTWLTARPSPGERAPERAAWTFVAEGLLWIAAGLALGVAAFAVGGWAGALLLFVSLTAASSGMGLFQVVVFHHCSHGAVFARREINRLVGRLSSAILIFKHFDAYRAEHMLHHNSRKLLTDEDEFTDFVLEMCRLEPEVPKPQLWQRVLLGVVLSPAFHLRFLAKRIRAAWFSPDRLHNAVGIGTWASAAAVCIATGHFALFLILWVLPATLLLQIATVGRILCEHRFPDEALIRSRGREFTCLVTAGVFPGSTPPALAADSLAGLAAWAWWWLDMLTVQLFIRVFVLVGDAPCHDFHHRRPATTRWTNYIHARQEDVDAGCPGFPLNYGENWGLVNAIDENLASLARTPRGLVG